MLYPLSYGGSRARPSAQRSTIVHHGTWQSAPEAATRRSEKRIHLK